MFKNWFFFFLHNFWSSEREFHFTYSVKSLFSLKQHLLKISRWTILDDRIVEWINFKEAKQFSIRSIVLLQLSFLHSSNENIYFLTDVQLQYRCTYILIRELQFYIDLLLTEQGTRIIIFSVQNYKENNISWDCRFLFYCCYLTIVFSITKDIFNKIFLKIIK